MKTETLTISSYEVEAFKKACKSLYPSVEYISHDGSKVTFKYNYPHTLFYLGQMMELKKQFEKI